MKNKVKIVEDVAVIEIVSKGEVFECIIDKDDLPIAKSIGTTWTISRSGSSRYISVRTYKYRDGKKVLYTLAHLILPPSENMLVDHINGNSLDNRRANLRTVSASGNRQNLINLVSTNKSGIRGVSWYKPLGKWRAKVCVNKKHYHLGYYNSVEAAEQVVKEFRRKNMPYSLEAREIR